MTSSSTTVGIIGAGPAGLVLAHRLADAGVDAVILERAERSYVEARVRAGVLEAPTVGLLDDMGLSDRLHRDGLVHEGVYLQWDGERHRIDFAALTGRAVTVYGQQEVVKDLIAAWVGRGGDIRFSTSVTGIDAPGQPGEGRATLRVEQPDGPGQLDCDVVAGCDGFHGVARASLDPASVRTYDRRYPFAWLGILARVAPSTDELIYAFHDRGFAMHSLRSSTISRLYLQVDPGDDIANWPDERIWSELQIRLESPGWRLEEGPIIEKGITPMRSFVVEPMRHGRLFLAGDAAHIVPPTGAKGMNLAVADVKVLADALVAWYHDRDPSGIDGYSDRCLERVWRVQDFSTTMTTLLHLDPSDDDFGRRLQRARQDHVAAGTSLTRSLADNYVGLPLP